MEQRMSKKELSIKSIFIRSVVRFSIIVMLTIGVLIGSLEILMYQGIILPANHAEKVLKNWEQKVASYSELDWLPEGCGYGVYTYEGECLESNMNDSTIQKTWKDYREGQVNDGTWYYFSFLIDDNICIVRYRVASSYNNQWCNNYLPNPTLLVVIAFGVLFILEVIGLASGYTKRLNKELTVVKEATMGVKMNQLDPVVAKTQVSEFNEVLDSLNQMKSNLKDSLMKQWELEEHKKSQMQALAHDIKTPLTILMGNADLLGETVLDEEQQEYCRQINLGADDIEQYLQILLSIGRSEDRNQLHKKEMNFDAFFQEVVSSCESIASKKDIHVLVCKNESVGTLVADEMALKRVFMNLLTNAIEYTPCSGKIQLSVTIDDLKLRVVIEDSGCGFSKQELTRATEQFYQGDESRNRKHHYGLGLYIAKNLVEHHDGVLELGSSEVLGGAKVIVTLSGLGKV